mgnify:CR=1 FL=1
MRLLAAERLQRRYGEEVASDPETFSRLTDTIIRQVGDIGRMVDEFSSFARMPRPTVKPARDFGACRQEIAADDYRGKRIRFAAALPLALFTMHDALVTNGGLKAGEKLIVSGIQKIGDGAPVKPE